MAVESDTVGDFEPGPNGLRCFETVVINTSQVGSHSRECMVVRWGGGIGSRGSGA